MQIKAFVSCDYYRLRCYTVLDKEANQQNKKNEDHYNPAIIMVLIFLVY